MPRLARYRQSQTARSRETEELARARVRAPGEHDQRGARDRPSQITSVSWPDGIAGSEELPRLSGTVREEIHDFDPAESPATREPDAAADGRIVAARVSGRGVEHHERDDRPRGIPPSPQPIAIATVRAERRTALHGRVKRISDANRDAQPTNARAVCSKSSVERRSDSWSIRSLFAWNILMNSPKEIRSLIRP